MSGPCFSCSGTRVRQSFVCYDICCGLKSVAKSFDALGNWRTVTLDLVESFKPDLKINLRDLDIRNFGRREKYPQPSHVHFSVECRTLGKRIALINSCVACPM